jgi:hypothetical protein
MHEPRVCGARTASGARRRRVATPRPRDMRVQPLAAAERRELVLPTVGHHAGTDMEASSNPTIRSGQLTIQSASSPMKTAASAGEKKGAEALFQVGHQGAQEHVPVRIAPGPRRGRVDLVQPACICVVLAHAANRPNPSAS